ncbi:cobalt ABC transporter ATP-binding protein [Fructilactobacillus lindneri]|uniref:Energy-coupling factor transporter transmembrane protein EcfT n=2 Tax=Fructilactobacillus lindneri TaxID=53444 RepID=A0A0R2JN18_9LACO|nr:energy-coupling factor transporter transmembrane component T [Fructilactobacillus lindneri]ANZ57952.1 cobalt ABC transporter ATP-binding protein [Fructilactobacillus lindneri]ANZ59222.1 cobalt ABC transporter ATP-binding protein [Fructilactobacillus lindneri]KRN78576.1 hypothetical protein IV52_GL000852 [Fructilactobacillus lindneri DSM 20690 = JCM 11027]POG98272.1 cobalt ABC transporter ATP-binding protein [Fructilactobacillus lindneri]POH01611.1 cobalt ABC transporter ATP-binding protein 
MNHVVFGSYLPGNSFIHRLNPALKILAVLLLITWTLFANNWLNYGLLAIFILLQLILSATSVKTVFRAIRPFLWLIMFTVLIQILFGNQGTIYWQWGPIKITSVGLEMAVLIFIRFTLIIIEATILTLTTSPNAIATGVEYLISPLKYLGVPVATISIMISIALRFIPTLVDELHTIMNAQKSRGVSFGSGGIIKRVKSICSLIIPILVSSFRHADNLADALSASGYEANATRSSYQQFHWTIFDTLCLVVVLILGILVILMRKI